MKIAIHQKATHWYQGNSYEQVTCRANFTKEEVNKKHRNLRLSLIYIYIYIYLMFGLLRNTFQKENKNIYRAKIQYAQCIYRNNKYLI